MRRYAISASSLLVLAAGHACADPQMTKGKLEAVTVYRGEALVTRGVDVAGAAGLVEMVVTDLPLHVMPGSLYAEGSDGISVRSVQFRTRPVAQDVRADVRKVDDEILAIQDQLADVQASRQRLDEQKAYLDKLDTFVAPTAQVEMTKGVLNPDTLTKLADYSGKQRDTISKTRLELDRKQRGLQGDLEVKQRERAKLTDGSIKTVYEAVVFLNKDNAAAGKLRVRYLVTDASWTPSYNARAETKEGKVTLEYFASVEQLSGEDWSSVQLELSTATPALVATAPSVRPMMVALGRPAPESPESASRKLAYFDAREDLAKKQRDIESGRNSSLAYKEQAQDRPLGAGGNAPAMNQVAGGLAPRQAFTDLESNELTLNKLAGEVQLLDVIAADKVVRQPAASKGGKRASEEGLSVTYTVKGLTSVPSRADRQLIQIASMPMKAEFVKVASPVLTQFVYDEANLTNEGGMVLLAGPVTAYSGGRFVGNSELPTVSAGERLTLGFGIDSSLRSTKELVEKTESIQGGNRVVELTYRLQVENFGTAPAQVRVLDRIPKARENEIRVTIDPASGKAPVQEGDEQAGKDKKNGILRWDLDVPAQAVGAKAGFVEYKFKLEYDKQMTVVGLDGK